MKNPPGLEDSNPIIKWFITHDHHATTTPVNTIWLQGRYVTCFSGKTDREGMEPGISEMAAIDQRHARPNTWPLQIVTNNWRWQWPLPHLSISTPPSLVFKALIFNLYVIFQTILCPESLATTHSVEFCSMVESVSDSRNTPLIKRGNAWFFVFSISST